MLRILLTARAAGAWEKSMPKMQIITFPPFGKGNQAATKSLKDEKQSITWYL
jgi:hypothetical protein